MKVKRSNVVVRFSKMELNHIATTLRVLRQLGMEADSDRASSLFEQLMAVMKQFGGEPMVTELNAKMEAAKEVESERE